MNIGATYKSKLVLSAGGVGRNIAEGLGKLYEESHVKLISVFGDDQVIIIIIFIKINHKKSFTERHILEEHSSSK